MPVDIFGNAGLDTQNIGQSQGGAMPAPQGNSNPVVDALIQKLNASQQTQKQVVLPQQLPPTHVQGGDVSGNFVNPSTSGGPAHNARVSLAQSIGGAVSQAINKHEDKEARDLSFDIQIMHTSMDTINDPNASPQDKQLAQQQLNDLTSDKAKMKKIQKALNIQMMGEDKRTPVEKQAVSMATKATQQGGQQGGQPNTQQPPSNQQGLNPMAQQLMRKMPTQTGLSPAAMATAELTKAGVIPSAQDILKFASDQQYYKVMEDKMGSEQATKFAKIQEDYDTKMQGLAQKAKEAEDKAKYQEILGQMRIEHERAYEAISQQRIGLMQDQLVEKQKKDAEDTTSKVKSQELQKLKTSSQAISKSITDLTKQKVSAQKAVNSTFGWTDKGKQARESLANINTQLQNATQKQHEIINRLESPDMSATTSTEVTNPELQKTYDALDKVAQGQK